MEAHHPERFPGRGDDWKTDHVLDRAIAQEIDVGRPARLAGKELDRPFPETPAGDPLGAFESIRKAAAGIGTIGEEAGVKKHQLFQPGMVDQDGAFVGRRADVDRRLQEFMYDIFLRATPRCAKKSGKSFIENDLVHGMLPPSKKAIMDLIAAFFNIKLCYCLRYRRAKTIAGSLEPDALFPCAAARGIS
jgi:hypothetical protein